jgi:UDPglucose 6-dehydrogenase
MKIGWIGLGKLGLPCALALAAYGGHEVYGYDISDQPKRVLWDGKPELMVEEGFDDLRHQPHLLHIVDYISVVAETCDLVIIAVQTPHPPGYDGTTPSAGPAGHDFEYAYLAQAVRDVVAAAPKPLTIVVLSTVLPGTMNRVIRPLVPPEFRLLYSPAFISLGTTIQEFIHPPFVLVGADDPRDAELLREAYDALFTSLAPFLVMNMQSAEIAKMAYNMAGTLRITFANMIAELCHKTGGDSDAVTEVLSMMPARSYMKGGMPDGGPCRPRDLAALSLLSQQLSFNLPFQLMQAREAHAKWIAGLALHFSDLTGLHIIQLGLTYKPETNLTAGSPALLVRSFLQDVWGIYDPRQGDELELSGPAVYLVTTRHPQFAELAYPEGSVVIDPFRYIEDQPGVTVVRIGRP